MKTRLTLYLGALLGVLFLYFAFQGVRLDQIWLTIEQLELRFIVAGVMFIMAEYVLRAYRWKLLLGERKRLKVNQLFSVLMIGYVSNVVIPLRMGELLRAHFLGTNYQVSRVRALATIVVERVFDVLMLVLLFGLCLIFQDMFPGWVKRGGLLAALAVAGALPLLYFCARRRTRIVKRLQSLAAGTRFSETISGIVDNFVLGLGALKELWNVFAVVAVSLLIWLTMIGSITMVLLAFPFNISLLAGSFVVVLLSLSMLLPAPPGNIGVYETFAMLAVLPFGVERDAALGFSLVLHSVELTVTIAIGAACFVREVGSVQAAAIRLWRRPAK